MQLQSMPFPWPCTHAYCGVPRLVREAPCTAVCAPVARKSEKAARARAATNFAAVLSWRLLDGTITPHVAISGPVKGHNNETHSPSRLTSGVSTVYIGRAVSHFRYQPPRLPIYSCKGINVRTTDAALKTRQCSFSSLQGISHHRPHTHCVTTVTAPLCTGLLCWLLPVHRPRVQPAAAPKKGRLSSRRSAGTVQRSTHVPHTNHTQLR